MNNHPWHVCVVIPARDEELLLPRCLESIRVACAAISPATTSDVILVDDGSADTTFTLAQNALRGIGTVIRTHGSIVGFARKAGVAAALHRHHGPRDRCWIANTDADCIVPPTWLSDQLHLAAEGADAITGIVSVDSFEEHDAAVPERFQRSYVIHPNGSHPHVHGANFGVRADWYLKAGEWGGLPTAEDHDLWRRLERVHANRLSAAHISVVTSGRRIGRAPSGFAGALAAHNRAAA